MRAISRFASLRRVVFSSAPVAAWNRRLNSSWRVSASRCSSSSSVRSRRSLALKEITFPRHELRLDRQLLRSEAERLLGERLRHTGELEHDAPRLDDGHPAFGRALALAHARLGRLLRERLVGEDVDPHLAAALDLARHRDASGLDLAVRDPAVLERLDSVVAEVDRRLTPRLATPAAAVHLAELRLLRKQHQPSAFFLRGADGFFPLSVVFVGSSTCVFGVVVSGASATGAGVVSTCGSITGCTRPSADFPASSVRGFSTRSPCVRGRAAPPRVRGAPARLPAPPPPGRFCPCPPRWPGRPRRTGPRPSRSWLRLRPDSREAPRPSVTPPRRRAVSWSPRRVSFFSAMPV